ncbi:MAG: protein kinase domain-containing protein [Archangium sp.]
MTKRLPCSRCGRRSAGSAAPQRTREKLRGRVCLPLMSECITDEVMAAWASGNVTPDVVSSVQQHIAGCAACRTVAAELARTAGSRPRPRTLGRYELREPVGAGGMGTVYAAWDPTVGRQGAVKLLHEGAVDSHRAERFRFERQVLGSLEHPNIARLLDAGETDDGRPWFAMDFGDGKPRDEACDAAKRTPRRRIELMLPVLRAVAAAHQQLVIHRDLKPSNILVDATGEPRLVDFGIARILEGVGSLTHTGVTPMTPAYASPEQVRREALTVTTDVYSLGVVLYELLTGVSPYETKPGDTEALLRAIAKTEVKPPSLAVSRASEEAVAARGLSRTELAGALSGDLDAIVLMALRREPGDRYQSVQALTDDLTAYLDDRPTLARRGDRAYRAALLVRRNRALVAGVTAAFIALCIGLVATIWQAQRAEAERDLAQARFNQVRQLAKTVLFKYHDGIADLPGSTELRQELVKDAQGYLEALSAQAAGDASLKQELASSYLKLGDVQGDPFAASLGDTDGAKESYLKALALVESLDDWDARRTRSAANAKLADLEEVTGSLEQALRMQLSNLEFVEAMRAERPDDLDVLAAIGRTELAAGQLLTNLERLEEARGHVERSIEVRRRIAGVRKDLPSRRAEAVSVVFLSRLLAEQGHAAEAIELGLRAEALLAALVAEFPDAVDPRRVLGGAWQSLIAIFRQEGRLEDALLYSKKSTHAARLALSRDPTNAVAVRDLFAALTLECSVLSQLRAYEQMRAPETEALSLIRVARESDPDNLQTVRNLAMGLLQFAYGAAWRNEFELAEQRLEEQTRLIAQLKAADPDDATLDEELAGGHDARALLRSRQGRLEEATVEFEKLVEADLAVAARQPESARLKNRVALAQSALASHLVRVAEKTHARADWERAREQLAVSEAAYAKLDDAGTSLGMNDGTARDRAELRTRVEAALAGKPLPPLAPL